MNITTNYCPKCGTNLVEGQWIAVICPNCKFDIEEAMEKQSPLSPDPPKDKPAQAC